MSPQASLSTQGTLRIFDFLGNSVLEEVQSVLAADLPGAECDMTGGKGGEGRVGSITSPVRGDHHLPGAECDMTVGEGR